MRDGILGVLAGADLPSELFKKWAKSARILLAADGGADRILEAGLQPNAIVGDMDSISTSARDCGAEIVELGADQATTDCDKLLAYSLNKSLLPISLIGYEGDRVDHVLATLQSAAKEPYRENVRFIGRSTVAWVLGPGKHFREFAGKRTVSLLPLARCEGVSVSGLRWMPSETLEPGGATSLSNESIDGRFTVELKGGLLFLVVGISREEVPFW